ncbi:MAG: hypothetical protein HY903_10125 [Deltaproteobacteria bacterium]|nr:hypothetical protein [Deltaproteobacteria bacterium]
MIRLALRLAASLWCGIALSCGAGNQSLTLTADPASIRADGETLVALSAAVIFRGDPIPDGKRVSFSCNEALLFERREDATPDVEGGLQTGATLLDLDTKGGVATAYLRAPTDQVRLEVTASLTTVNKDVVTDTLKLAVTPPPLVLSGVGNGNPATTLNYFDFHCESENVGGFVADRAAIEVACVVTAKDATGRELPHVPVHFYSEAGEMRQTNATAGAPRRFTYVVPVAAGVEPRDVAPAEPELAHDLVDYNSDPNVIEQNPRDGLVTILAVVKGEEGYVDANHNGVYDSGEEILDEGEPFLDYDDDGVFDADFDPPPCCDANGNGRVDGMNGRHDSDVFIGRMAHILWTGEVDYSASKTFLSATPRDIDAEAQTVAVLRLADANFNPLASLSTSDRIDFSLATTPSSGKARFEPAAWDTNGVDVEGTHGMWLDDRFPGFIFGLGDPVQKPIFGGFQTASGCADCLKGREWSFSVVDARAATGQDICKQLTWTVTATAGYTIAWAYSGASFRQRQASTSTSGNLLPKVPKPAQCP